MKRMFTNPSLHVYFLVSCTSLNNIHGFITTPFYVLLRSIYIYHVKSTQECLFNLDVVRWINLQPVTNLKSIKLIRCEYFLFLLQRTSLCTIKYAPVFSGSCARTCVSYIMQYFQSGLQWRFRRMMRNFHGVEWSKSFFNTQKYFR